MIRQIIIPAFSNRQITDNFAAALGGIILRFAGDVRPLALSMRLSDANILFLNDMTAEESEFIFTFLPAEPVLVLTSSNFDRIFEHFYNSLVIYGNCMYNYFDAPPLPATDAKPKSLTMKVTGGAIFPLKG